MSEETTLTPAQIIALEAGRTPPPGHASVMAWLRSYHDWLKGKGHGSIAMCADYLGLTRSAVYSWLISAPASLPNNGRIAQMVEFQRLWDESGKIPEPPIDELTVGVTLAHRDRLRELASESGMSPEEYAMHAVTHAVEQGLVFGVRVVVEARKGKR